MEPPLFLGEVESAGVGCPDTLAPSYTSLATREVDVVANEAEKKKKKVKYTEYSIRHKHLETATILSPLPLNLSGSLEPRPEFSCRTLVNA